MNLNCAAGQGTDLVTPKTPTTCYKIYFLKPCVNVSFFVPFKTPEPGYLEWSSHLLPTASLLRNVVPWQC